MFRLKALLYNLTFALNCLLIFLLLLEQQLHVPAWLQVAGRMHPLVLHFPIVLLLVSIVWEGIIFFKPPYAEAKQVGDVLLLSAAFTAVITALMGLFLSREEGYTPEMLLWHKWGGVGVSLLLLGWYAFRHVMRRSHSAFYVTAFASIAAIIITGHQGANITHGQDFLLAPVLAERAKPPVLLEDAVVYTDMVQPILQSKCNSCHNQQKQKGGLILETTEGLLKGGKNGELWDSTAADWGLMLRRIHLPETSKKHMPPQGKPQLSDAEIQVLYHWIKSGASFTTKVTDLPPTDSLRLLAQEQFQTIETDDYTFAPADEKKVAGLTTNYRVVAPLAIGSPALGVEFFSAAQFNPKQVADLLEVKEQIVSLNLNKMPVQDGDLKNIGQFKNLRRLNLSFTSITGAGLPALQNLKELKQLSLSGTKVKLSDLQALTSLPKLTHLYVWNTEIKPKDAQALQQQFKNLTVESGFKGDTVVIKLNPPVIENEEQIVHEPTPLKMKHYINGAVIRYTLDGTEPDSVTSPVYAGGLRIDSTVTVKAKAFKPGWISSNVVSKTFFKAGAKPDSVQLVYPPDPKHSADGAASITDGQKGELNFGAGNWLGYREKPMEALLFFKTPTPVTSVTISSLVDINTYLMPPQEIEVWGGTSTVTLRLLKRLAPQQPAKEALAYMQRYTVPVAPVQASVLKVVVKPVNKLPSWHRGKGEKAWVFVDEIFVN